MENKQKGDPYTMSFIERKGGIEEVARKTKLNRQTVRQVATGRNAPSYEFIMRMMQTYPAYDIRAGASKPQPSLIADGDGYADYPEVNEAPAVDTSLSTQVLAAENAGLKKEIARLEKTVSILEKVVGSQLGKDFDGSKTESSNESTQGEQLRLDLAFAERKEKRFIPILMRDAFGITPRWSNKRNG